MPSKWKIVGYFTIAGLLPITFFTIKKWIDGDVTSFDMPYFLDLAGRVGISITTTGFISSCVLFIPIAILERRLAWEGNWWKRSVIELISTEVVAMLAMTIVVCIYVAVGYHPFGFGSDAFWQHLNTNLFITVVMNIILVMVYEGIVIFHYWKNSLIRNEKLEKESIASKFEALKNQVNPHFLFNSLNTLSNLIHQDAEKAEDFVDEFSYIYRYVLEKKDQLVVTVQEELDFVKSYLKLCQIRFGEALEIDMHLDFQELSHLVPTLSVQTLVENAIKHNRITKKEPLKISITTCSSFLVVSNNYQPREEKPASTGIGLQNIKERYQILSDRKPTFELHNSDYVAKLPILLPS